MRFRSRQQQPPYFSRRDQLRLLGLVGLLALVLVAVKVTADPGFWAWMFPEEAAENDRDGAEKQPGVEDIDFSVREDEDDAELKPGEFLARPQPDDRRADGGRQASRRREPAGTHPEADASGSPEVEIAPRILGNVKDNMLGIRRDEAEAYYAVLARARDLSADRLQQAAEEYVGFAVLMTHPDYYRGKPITVRGQVRQLVPLSAGENAYGIQDLWEAWLFAPDSGNHPYRIVCLDIPEGIPRGEQIDPPVEVRVTGYFFKVQGYHAEGGPTTAPLLLARRLQWFPPQPGTPPPDAGPAPYVLGLLCLIAAALALTVWRFSVSDRTAHARHIRRLSEPPPEAIDALRDVQAAEPDEMFRELGRRDRAGDSDQNTA